MKKIMCERCFEEYDQGEIFSSEFFSIILCIPCDEEYRKKLEKFHIEFFNNQPERLSEKTPKGEAIV